MISSPTAGTAASPSVPFIARALIYLGRDDFFFFFTFFFFYAEKKGGRLLMFTSKVAEPRHGVGEVAVKASRKFPARLT